MFEQGAFSRLTDDTLSGHGLWLPRKARNRITKLAGLVSNRLERQNEKLLARLKRLEEKELERQRIQAALEAGEDVNAAAEEKQQLLDITEETDADLDSQEEADKKVTLEQEILHQLMNDDDNEMKEDPASMQQLLPPLPPETVVENSTTPLSSRAATATKKPAHSAELQKKIATIRRYYKVLRWLAFHMYDCSPSLTSSPSVSSVNAVKGPMSLIRTGFTRITLLQLE